MGPFISHFKNEKRSLLLNAQAIEALERIVDERLRYYNVVRRHFAPDGQPPLRTLERQLNDVEKDRLLHELFWWAKLKPAIMGGGL
jgi:hypothetical protein